MVDPEKVRSATSGGRWFGPADRPLLGWLSAPGAGAGESGVLILPPVGYAYWSVHRTLRTLAERLAGAGHLALRLDYDGTGDSAGEQTDPDRLVAWLASAEAGAAELRALGARRLAVVGVRLGGALALREPLGADAVIAWAPVLSGRRYVREIRLLAAEGPDGTLVAGGSAYLPRTLEELSALSAQDIQVLPAARALLIGDSDAQELAARLDAEFRADEDGARALEQPAEYATVPEDLLDAIVQWIGPGAPGRGARVIAARNAASFGALREDVIELGPERLVAIASEPASGAARATLVLLNTGSEPHIGPGRAWVEYSRALAAGGFRCVRADFRGWGESPEDGFAPGRPYDAHCIDDAVSIVRALRERFGGPVVVAGLCASAWVALQMVLREPVDGVVALNPQLYWKPGDPVEATMTETRVRRTTARGREALGGRLHVWNGLDLLGQRGWVGSWLDQLEATRVPITLAFAAGDDGIEFLRNRHARRLTAALRSGKIELIEVPDIDHSMGRLWLRERIVEILRERLEAACARPADLSSRAAPRA